tara:strand:- start:269 stop:490 length:222 start_codon:yes stop_codon:yes gene_type:complete
MISDPLSSTTDYDRKYKKENKEKIKKYFKMYDKLTETEKKERRTKKPCEFCGFMISEGYKKRHQENSKCSKNK